MSDQFQENITTTSTFWNTILPEPQNFWATFFLEWTDTFILGFFLISILLVPKPATQNDSKNRDEVESAKRSERLVGGVKAADSWALGSNQHL